MLLTCPYCETGFRVDPVMLGKDGRTVRCARCRESWFAAPVQAEPAMAEAFAENVPPSISIPADQIAEWTDPAPVDVASSPSIAAEQAPDIIVTPIKDMDQEKPNLKIKRRPPIRGNSRKPIRIPRFAAVALGFMAVAVAGLVGRESVVRFVPDLAGVYAAVGMPVNLRGLEFRNVKTLREMQDGIPVLVIEGDVVNVVKHAVEVPRVRLAVLGPNGQELYSWTALLQRSILADNEKVSFRSRLASPPPESREVLVRFLTRADLTASIR
jgi:predicted Zn finger-like uncharacterized protein